jgi:hypothetical protein
MVLKIEQPLLFCVLRLEVENFLNSQPHLNGLSVLLGNFGSVSKPIINVCYLPLVYF